jgi:uncharacterized protein YyaL (SSP411 family)
VRLYYLTDGGEWRAAAERLIGAFAGGDPREVTQSPLLLVAWDFLQRGGCVAVEGDPADPRFGALAAAARRAADPAIAVLPLDRAAWPDGVPGGRTAPPQTPAAMLCRGQVCSLPERDPKALSAALASLKPPSLA